MIQYRKSGSRTFYKLDESTGHVIRVTNKEMFSQVDVSYNRLIMEDAKDEATREITKDEFVIAYHLAMERIQTFNVL